MTLMTVGNRRMGRPKKDVPMTNVRISQDALDLVKEAAKVSGEAIVDYVSRVVSERAEQDLRAEQERLRKLIKAKRRTPDDPDTAPGS